MSLVTWDIRTVLSSVLPETTASATLPAAEATASNPVAARLTLATIWSYLIHHSKSLPQVTSWFPSDPLPVRHFLGSDFQLGWGVEPQQLGEGASYSVRKHTLAYPDAAGRKQFVAVKRLNVSRPGDRAAEERAVATVLKELRILTHIPLRTHASIVSMIGYLSEVRPGSTGINISLVMSFASHGTLREFLTAQKAAAHSKIAPTGGQGQSSTSFLGRAHLVHDVALGLEALHACGIVHGDLKLENVLVFEPLDEPDGRPRARLSDFGHSLVDLESSSGAAGPYLGTPVYNAPEVRRARATGEEAVCGADAFRRCDVFSLGLLSWEVVLLSGGRYYAAILDDKTGSSSQTELLKYLDELPRDELLLRVLSALQEAARMGKLDTWLLRMLSQLFQAALRDETRARKAAGDIVAVFRKETAFNGNDNLHTIFTGGQLPMSPLPPFNPDSDQVPITRSLQDLPQSVQVDLVSQLRQSSEVETVAARRRLALYNLALCCLSGFGSVKIDTGQGLALLCQAAELGSSSALSIVFRLHDALGKNVPSTLWEIKHRIVDMEKSLRGVSSAAYFSQRLRGLEKIYQVQLLCTAFDIIRNGETLVSRVRLVDLEQRIRPPSRYLGQKHNLECVSHPRAADEPVVQGYLLVIAARLGLISLVQFLMEDAAPYQLYSTFGDVDILSAACRGGHLHVVKFLVSRKMEPIPFNKSGTPLHYLNQFTPHDARHALSLLTASRTGKQCLMSMATVHDPTSLSHFRAVGTPLEIAIAANNAKLVESLLTAEVLASSGMYEGIGWTDNSFPLAMALNLTELLSHLGPYQLAYKSWLKERRSDRAQPNQPGPGETAITSPGLFDLVHPFDPFLPLLIHGPSLRHALETTVDWSSRLSPSMNYEDAQGRTPLSRVAYSSPCSFNTDIVSVLISRGATFGSKELPHDIAFNISLRNDHAAPELFRLLLDKGILSRSTKTFFNAVGKGYTDLVRILLEHDQGDNRININDPLIVPDIDGVPLSYSVISSAIEFLPQPAAMVRLLLDHGANINDDRYGSHETTPLLRKTPLQKATSMPHCDAETIDLLVERGAELWFSNGGSILDAAARTNALVGGNHVLFQLLKHTRIRALIDAPCVEGDEGFKASVSTRLQDGQLITPLKIAVMLGIPGAVHALLQEGARVDIGPGGVSTILRTAVNGGRRPHVPHAHLFDPGDAKELYDWRVKTEEIILAILSRSNPGHGKTRLHVAAELGNLRRVQELVERDGYRASAGDSAGRTPWWYVDQEALEDYGPDGTAKTREEWEKGYARDVKEIASYLTRKAAEEMDISSVQHDPQGLDALIARLPLSENGPKGVNANVASLERDLARLRLEHNEAEASAGDGSDDPASRLERVGELCDQYKRTLGGSHPKTLRAIAGLADVMLVCDLVEEAEDVQNDALQIAQAMLPPNDPLLIEVVLDRVGLLLAVGRYADAREHAQCAVDRAVEAFCESHPLVLEAHSKLAVMMSHLDDPDLDTAIEVQQIALARYESMDADDQWKTGLSSRSRDRVLRDKLVLMLSLLFAYCDAGRFDDAADVAIPEVYGTMLNEAGPASFYLAFNLVDNNIAHALEDFGLHDLAEAVHQAALAACLRRHGQRKAYCTKVALQRLAKHYRGRGRWEDETKTLQRTVEIIRATQGMHSEDYLQSVQDLVGSLMKNTRWAEATLVQEQLLHGLEESALEMPRVTISLKYLLCQSLRGENDLARSEHYGRAAAAEARERFGAGDDQTLEANLQLGQTLTFAGETKEAIDILDQNLGSIVRIHEEVHYMTRRALESLCMALMRARRLTEAEIHAARLLKVSREIPAPELPEASGAVVATALHILGLVKELSRTLDEAEGLYAESVEEELAFLNGKHSISSLYTLQCLAKLHIEAGDLKAAQPVLARIIAEAPPEYAAGQPQTMFYIRQYMGCIAEETPAPGISSNPVRGDAGVPLQLARTHHEQASVIGNSISLYGEESLHTINYVSDFAQILTDPGHFQDADPSLTRVLQFRRGVPLEEDPGKMSARKNLCLHLELGQRALQDAMRCFRGSNDNDRQSEPRRKELWEGICGIKESLADTCRILGWTATQAMHQRDLMRLCAEHLGEEHEETLWAIAGLASCLIDRGDLDEAEELIVTLSQTCERVCAGDAEGEKKFMAEPLKVSLYQKQDRLEDALAVQRQILSRQPDNIEANHNYTVLLIIMERYREALEAIQMLLVLMESSRDESSPEFSGIGGQEDVAHVELLVQMADIYLKLEMPKEAEGVGKRAVESFESWEAIIPLSKTHLKLYLNCLKELKPTYEALGKAQGPEMTQIESKIQDCISRLDQMYEQQATRAG